MKNKITFILCFCILQTAYSQITNVFPTNDSVGIGTTTPQAILQVFGDVKFGSRVFDEIQFSYGYNNLTSNTTGISNVAFGDDVLTNNTTGSNNTGIGLVVLNQNTVGTGNVAIGHQTMFENVGGNYNTAIGFTAFHGSGVGSNNTALGANTLYNCFKGSDNTAVGEDNMYNTNKGNKNTSVGASALGMNTLGSNNTAIGYDAETSSGNLSNASAFGNGALVDASNKVRIGNSSVTSIGGQVGWTIFSDARIKNTIQQNVPGLEFINLLNPVTYHYDIHTQNQIMGVNASQEEIEGQYEIEKIQYTGFIAQEVDAAAQKINYEFSGIDKTGTLMGLRYSEFVVPLVKAVQELDETDKSIEIRDTKQDEAMQQMQSENTALKNKNIELENRIAQIENLLNINTTINTANETDFKQVLLTTDGNTALLGQNIPNPFNGKTMIQYYIPENSKKALIKISSINGKEIKTISLESGNGTIEIDAAQIPSGSYTYTLIIDGRNIDTKQMILTK